LADYKKGQGDKKDSAVLIIASAESGRGRRRVKGEGDTQNTTPTGESKRRRQWSGERAARPVALIRSKVTPYFIVIRQV
jgi:hypothetical protein